ncbi:MAG: hypothetical protein AAGG48_29785 [Planctomycetota bacterium]
MNQGTRKPFALVSVVGCICILLGIAIGYALPHRDDSVAPSIATQEPLAFNVSLGNELDLRLPESFFADLPVSENGRDRLVSVDTFTNPYLGEMVLPTFPQ